MLAGADLDHTLGLLLLRELHPLNVYATPSVATILRGNSMFGMLNRVPQQVNWLPITPGKIFPVQAPGESVPCFSCDPISVSNRYPAYVRGNADSALVDTEAVLGLILRWNGESGSRPRSLAYFPNVPHISDQLLATLSSVDLLMFDGTFWSDDELQRLQPGAETARQMGHLPVAGPSGSLEILSQIKVPRIYIHINNTNPMLNENSREYRQIREAGWQLAEDGWQAQL